MKLNVDPTYEMERFVQLLLWRAGACWEMGGKDCVNFFDFVVQLSLTRLRKVDF